MIGKLVKLGLILATIACPLLIISGLFGSVHPALDMVANFRFHLGLLILAVGLLWIFLKQWRVALSTVLVGIFAITQSAVGLPSISTSSNSTSHEEQYHLLLFNVLYNNPNKRSVMELVEKHDPDIFLGVELATIWSDQVFRWKEKYPHTFHCPEWADRGGFYIFSKFPIHSSKSYCHSYAAFGYQAFEIDGKPITIGGVHLRWPWPASQPRQLRELKPILPNLAKDALVAGDFNAATWTYAVNSFAKNGGLSVVPNIGSTWLFNKLPDFLRPILGLPIDNVMQKGSVQVLNVKRLEATGSDHLPLLVTFAINK